MINNLKIRDSNVWKFVGDSLGEIVNKNEESNIQTLTIYARWKQVNYESDSVNQKQC